MFPHFLEHAYYWGRKLPIADPTCNGKG